MAELSVVKRKIAEFESKGEIDKAIVELAKAIQEFPKEGSLYNKLGDLYIKVNRQNEALDVYEKGAIVFKEETYFSNAIALCRKINRLDKERVEIYYLLGELHKELGQRVEAANYLLEYADRKMKARDLEAALNTYNIIKELTPNNPKILQTISQIYAQLGKKKQGAELLKEAKEIETKQKELKESIITTRKVEEPPIKVTEEKVKEEIKEAAVPKQFEAEEKEEVITKPPKKEQEELSLEDIFSPEVVQLLQGEVIAEAKEVVSAEEKIEEISTVDKTIELAELYLNLGSEEEAIDCFRSAAAEAWKEKNLDKALDLNKKLAELRPLDLACRQRLVEIAKSKGDKELQVNFMLELAEALNRRDAKSEAYSLYEKILEIDSENVKAHEMLASFERPKEFIDLGEVLRTELEGEKRPEGIQNIDELISRFRKEVFESIGEGDYHSHYDLGVAYKGMGLHQEAIEEFEIAAKDINLKLKAYEMIASSLLEREKVDEAIRVLNEALRLANRPTTEYFGIHFLLGNCFEIQNNWTQALRSYVNAYNIDKTVPDLAKKITALKNKILEEQKKKVKIAAPPKVEEKKPTEPEKVVVKKSKVTYL